MSTVDNQTRSPELLGHPTGLFTLFFVEMWERFSYYGMRALLVFYMIKGFLGYNDDDAYAVYGAYTALVYAAPFIGGMLADRLLGARRAVIIGGMLMAAGHLLMTIEQADAFFMALALLIVGNGFFKPNISTIVGGLYPKDSNKKDTGFTIFYMGINLGAAMSPVVCGYVGETYGWHWGFGLATAGMLLGVAVFVVPNWVSQVLILTGALGTSIAMPFLQDSTLQLVVRLVLAIALAAAGIIAVLALGRGGLPKEAGGPKDPAALRRKLAGFLPAEWAVYIGIFISVPLIALVVQRNQLAGQVLVFTGVIALSYILYEALFRSTKVERERVYVALILMFFSMLFWAFFEQAGSSVNNFTDRNIDRVLEKRQVAESEVGETIKFRVPPRADAKLAGFPLLSQEQLGYPCDPALLAQVYRTKARQDERKAKEAAGTETEAADANPEDAKQPEADTKVSVSVATASVQEDSSGSLTFTFDRGTSAAKPLTFKFEANGSATPELPSTKSTEDEHDEEHSGADYTLTGVDKIEETTDEESGNTQYVVTATIPADAVSTEVVVAPKADKEVEWNEKVTFEVRGGEGYAAGDKAEATATIDSDDYVFTITHLSVLRDEAVHEDASEEDKIVSWPVTKDHVGMSVGGSEIPASEFQAANPIFIIVFGLVFSALWGFLDRIGWEPSTPVKFAAGLFQLGLAFGLFWYGAHTHDSRGMVLMSWLLLGYLLQTTGELCLSPVGLSMITKLSPTRIVSTIMGAWFLATAFSNYLAGMIAMLTGVSHGGQGEQVIPAPLETVSIYGNVFGQIAVAAMASGVICFILSPLLNKWMHHEVED